jgi:hypothetical protein
MPESIINLIKGDKAGDETDYRDALSVNMHTVLRPMFGVQGYMQQSYGLTKYGSVDPIPPANEVSKPTNAFPANGASVDVNNLTVQSTAFAYQGEVQTHTATDWQFASDAGFTNIVHESLDDAVNLVAYDASNQVPDDAITYWRCRHYGNITGASEWSDGTNFDTADANKVLQPTNIFPAEGATVDLSELVLQSSDFAVEGEAQTHVSSDWQIANDPEFTDIYWESIDDTENLTAVVVAGNPIKQPTNTFPADGQVEIDWQDITVTGSAFDVAFGPAQTHTATDWQFASDDQFTNIIHESLNDTQNLESYDVSGNVPDEAVTYWRHRHFGSLTGASEYSATTSFDTSSTPLITDYDHPNLIILYTMDNITGSTLVNESALGIDGAIVGATQVPGKDNQALNFPNASDIVNLNNLVIGTTACSISFWTNQASATLGLVFEGSDLNTASPGTVSAYFESSTLLAVGFRSAAGVARRRFTIPAQNGDFHHFTIVIDSNIIGLDSILLYKNGVSMSGGSQGTAYGVINLLNNMNSYIGARAGGVFPMTMAVDQFRIFNRVVTPEEVTELFEEFPS